MTTALVTGAYGFVGRHVARALARSGVAVTGIGHGNWTAQEAAAWGVTQWRSADVDLESLADLAIGDGTAPATIVHCAGSGSVPFSYERPREDFRRSVDTTLAVFEFARLHAPGARIVIPSSAAVYGLAETLPIATDTHRAPLSPYGVHKAMAEDIARSYAVHFGLNAVIVRLFSVYGTGLRKQLLWDACTKLSRGTGEFGGTGDETRDWLHVEDAAQLLIAAAANADRSGPVFNGGAGIAVSVRRVVERLAQRLGAPAPRFTQIVRPGDPLHFVADIAASTALGWSPRHHLDAGIDDYADWFRRSLP